MNDTTQNSNNAFSNSMNIGIVANSSSVTQTNNTVQNISTSGIGGGIQTNQFGGISAGSVVQSSVMTVTGN